MNKRPALFSPVYDRTGRNPFQKNDSDKPTAKDPEQAIQWARNLILQASIMTNSYEEQNKLLELLDVFRDYTEKGRVTNQISDKLSAKLAFHSATLANASEKAAKTLKKATATVAGQNN
ncbi:NMDAR2-C domain containing protein [Pyrenophora tritici-repentis]|nr:NMDAR2-C domain containing protein [Pyrenophora tritici-repentis]